MVSYIRSHVIAFHYLKKKFKLLVKVFFKTKF